MRSKVKSWLQKKGFGFILAPEGSGVKKDIFVHYKHLEGEGFRFLKVGDTVEFEIVDGDKGPMATKVRVINPETADDYDNFNRK